MADPLPSWLTPMVDRFSWMIHDNQGAAELAKQRVTQWLDAYSARLAATNILRRQRYEDRLQKRGNAPGDPGDILTPPFITDGQKTVASHLADGPEQYPAADLLIDSACEYPPLPLPIQKRRITLRQAWVIYCCLHDAFISCRGIPEDMGFRGRDRIIDGIEESHRNGYLLWLVWPENDGFQRVRQRDKGPMQKALKSIESDILKCTAHTKTRR